MFRAFVKSPLLDAHGVTYPAGRRETISLGQDVQPFELVVGQ
jgi:hypothetical protein